MELGSKSQNRDGLLGPKAIMAVYMNPLGYECTVWVMDPEGCYYPKPKHLLIGSLPREPNTPELRHMA